MTHRAEFITFAAITAATASCLIGCKKKEPPPPPPPPKQTYTPPPPPPEPVNVDVLVQSVGADARVQFPQQFAPVDEGFARAAIMLADSLARGDESALRDVLTQPGQSVLDELIGTGGWYDSTENIEVVRIVELNEFAMTLTLAVQDPDGAYPLKWRGVSFGGNTKFEGVQVDDIVMRRASDFDGGVPEKVAQAPEEEDDASGEADSSPTEPEPEEEEIDDRDGRPVRKQTPGGPIDIPGTQRPPP